MAMNEASVFTFADAESAEVAEAADSDVGVSHLFVINELRESSKIGPCWRNLTRKFYADKCLHCVTHEDLRPQVLGLMFLFFHLSGVTRATIFSSFVFFKLLLFFFFVLLLIWYDCCILLVYFFSS